MYPLIVSLKLTNFKSFIGVVNITDFNHLTVLTGYNYLGKCNLVDAIQWVFNVDKHFESREDDTIEISAAITMLVTANNHITLERKICGIERLSEFYLNGKVVLKNEYLKCVLRLRIIPSVPIIYNCNSLLEIFQQNPQKCLNMFEKFSCSIEFINEWSATCNKHECAKAMKHIIIVLSVKLHQKYNNVRNKYREYLHFKEQKKALIIRKSLLDLYVIDNKLKHFQKDHNSLLLTLSNEQNNELVKEKTLEIIRAHILECESSRVEIEKLYTFDQLCQELKLQENVETHYKELLTQLGAALNISKMRLDVNIQIQIATLLELDTYLINDLNKFTVVATVDSELNDLQLSNVCQSHRLKYDFVTTKKQYISLANNYLHNEIFKLYRNVEKKSNHLHKTSNKNWQRICTLTKLSNFGCGEFKLLRHLVIADQDDFLPVLKYIYCGIENGILCQTQTDANICEMFIKWCVRACPAVCFLVYCSNAANILPIADLPNTKKLSDLVKMNRRFSIVRSCLDKHVQAIVCMSPSDAYNLTRYSMLPINAISINGIKYDWRGGFIINFNHFEPTVIPEMLKDNIDVQRLSSGLYVNVIDKPESYLTLGSDCFEHTDVEYTNMMGSIIDLYQQTIMQNLNYLKYNLFNHAYNKRIHDLMIYYKKVQNSLAEQSTAISALQVGYKKWKHVQEITHLYSIHEQTIKDLANTSRVIGHITKAFNLTTNDLTTNKELRHHILLAKQATNIKVPLLNGSMQTLTECVDSSDGMTINYEEVQSLVEGVTDFDEIYDKLLIEMLNTRNELRSLACRKMAKDCFENILKEKRYFDMQREQTEITYVESIEALSELSNKRKAKLLPFCRHMDHYLQSTFIEICAEDDAQVVLLGADETDDMWQRGIFMDFIVPRKSYMPKIMFSNVDAGLASLAVLFTMCSYTDVPFVILDNVDELFTDDVMVKLANFLAKRSNDMQIIILTKRIDFLEKASSLIGILGKKQSMIVTYSMENA